MKYYSVPADFKKETIAQLAALNQLYPDSKVMETYGQISKGTAYEAGRILKDIPPVDLEHLADYIAYSKSHNIGFNYTMNGPCMGNKEFTPEGVSDIKKFLGALYEAGVRSITVALPSLFPIIQSTGLDFEIKASTLCQITNTNKALSFKKAGANRIVLEESINREFETLRRIVREFGSNVEVIINTLCYKDCTYRMFHYNQMGHDSVAREKESIKTYYNHLCMLKRWEKVSNILKLSWIRPEDIKLYAEIGIGFFKIQGRHTVFQGDPVRVVKCYMDESYDGNLIELLELFNPPNSFSIYLDNRKLDGYLEPFYHNPDFCKRDCNHCGYCDSFVQKCADFEKAQAMNEMATKFYQEYDEFTSLVYNTEHGDDYPSDIQQVSRSKKIAIDFEFGNH
jgi:collagenase-like PrtC family protease